MYEQMKVTTRTPSGRGHWSKLERLPFPQSLKICRSRRQKEKMVTETWSKFQDTIHTVADMAIENVYICPTYQGEQFTICWKCSIMTCCLVLDAAPLPRATAFWRKELDLKNIWSSKEKRSTTKYRKLHSQEHNFQKNYFWWWIRSE